MRRTILFCTATILLTSPAYAQVYKCKVGGRTVFTDQPCDETAKPIAVRPGAGYHVPTQQAGQEDAAAPATAAPSAPRSRLEEADRRVKQRIIQDKIANQENRIIALRQRRDDELAELRRRKGYANKNLAGATWEQSISTEMQAINSRYDTEMRIIQSDIEQLRREYSDLN